MLKKNLDLDQLNKKYKKHKNYYQILALMLMLILLFPLLTVKLHVSAASDLFDWRKNDIMDTTLSIVNNKAGEDDVFLEMNVKDSGLYTLEYYLEDGRKTTVDFVNNYESLDVSFKVQEYNPTDPANPTEITQDLIDLSYLEINYNDTIPTWKYSSSTTVDSGTSTLDFSIERSASAKYPGLAFQMDNKMFIAKWDFQDDTLYILFDNYEKGQIMPVTLTNPSGDFQTIKILKGLEDFLVEPTYLIEDPDNPGTNVEVSPVTHPNANNYKPGNRPGLRYNFKQPKELDESNWTYGYDDTDLSDIRAIFELEDIGSTDYLDFNILLQNSADQRVYEIPSENGDQTDPTNQVNYTYNADTYEYEILIVQDKSDLANQDSIVEWNALASSRIYNTSVGFQFENDLPDYEFSTFIPEGNFAYTYLEYSLERSDQQEAYLKLKPYQLGSEDEVEYTVLYSKIIAAELDPVNDLWLKHYQSDGSSSGTINIPVPFKADSYQDAYQIIISFSGDTLKSQVLNYRAIDDDNVPPTTPSIQGIENLYVVPPDDDEGDNPSKIQFDLAWDAIENRSVTELDDVFQDNDPTKKDAIYYEVLVNDIPDLLDDNPFQVFRVYEVYKDATDGLYKLKVHDNTTALDRPSNTSNYTQGYNSLDELFRMEKIVIYENDVWSNRIDTLYDEDADTYTITERNALDNPGDYETDFEFPGVNYVRIRAITETDGVLGVSEYSVPVSLSLSMLKYNIPIVEDISYEPFYSLIDGDPMGVTLDWPAVDLTTYETNMLDPVDKEIVYNDGITYSVYLSEDRDPILNLNDNNDNYTEVSLDASGHVVIDDATLSLLRGTDSDGFGNVIYFDLPRDTDSTADIVTRIEGLDLNNSYYIRVVVNINVYDNTDNTYEIRRGDPSTVEGITTPIIPEEPGEDDAIPLAPENFQVAYYDESALSAQLSWSIPDEVTVEEDTFGFEVFSIEDLRLPDTLDAKDIQVSDIIADSSLAERNTEAWRIFYEGADIVLKKYDIDTDSWVDQDLSLLSASDSAIAIIDESNSPNRVNYYYVRTINVNGGAAVKMSNWVEQTLTTAPVQGPINLIIDYDSDYDHDGRYQTIIRFDAPITDTALVDSDYMMEIFAKADADLDYTKSTKVTSLTDANDTFYSKYLGEEEGPVGYRRLYYVVSGLSSGQQYAIKVRIEDRTNEAEILPDGSETYPKSPYSDKVMTRTEFDQDDYDKTQKYDQYIEYYLKKANELLQEPYFVLGETDDEMSLKYRYDYVDGFLQMNKDGVYDLHASYKKSTSYYIPANMIEDSNDLNVTLTIQPSDQYISIKPYSLGADVTDEISTMIDDIADYDASLEDYYLEILLMVGDYEGKVYGQDPSSELMHIDMNVVGSSKVEDDIEFELKTAMETAISNNETNLINLLDQELDKGINDVKLTRIVYQVLDDVAQEFSALGKIAFDQYLDDTSRPIDKLNKSITIGLTPKNIDDSNTMYSKSTGDWKAESSTYYNGRYHMTTDTLGSYISVDQLSTSNLSDNFNSTQIDIINKYKLNQVFTSYELTHPDEGITNMQMIQTLSRLMGADEDHDDQDYIKANGIDLPYLSDFSMADRETASYLYVEVYAAKNEINLDVVTIPDYNAIENLSSIKSLYQDSLLKGVSLGIIESDNGIIDIDRQVTIGEFLDLIENIDK